MSPPGGVYDSTRKQDLQVVDQEVTPQHGVAQDNDLVIFGKHAGATHLEMLQEDPQYRNWVMDTSSAWPSTFTPEDLRRPSRPQIQTWTCE